MNFAIDVGYHAQGATAAGVAFEDWNAPHASHEYSVFVPHVEPYQPGKFYKRELPCIQKLVEEVTELNEVVVENVVIDGFVWLSSSNDSPRKPGLGAYLYELLQRKINVIGVAKTDFAGAEAVEVFRGGSKRPLFVTAVGMTSLQAASHIQAMHGRFRIPTLLRRVDQLSRIEIH